MTTELPQVIVDANVLLSLLTDRNKKQRADGQELLRRAGRGEVTIVLPQFIVFETIYVLRSVYRYSASEITAALREAIALPGVILVDDCPWPVFFEHWSDLRPDIGDASILALAVTKRYDSVATFDRGLSKRAKSLGVAPYW